MKKIKLVVSDFHLGNGRYLPDGSVNTLEHFLFDEKFVEFVSYYGEQEDTQIELILNGDFFNHIQLMPEEQDLGILTERAAISKTEAIIAGHAKIFETLKSFNAKAHHRLVFIMGNHDPQLLWKGVQEVIRREVQGEVVFVDNAYRFDEVHIEHGHQLEPIFRFQPDRYFLTRGFKEPVLNLPWGVFFVKDYLYETKRKRPYIDKVKPYGKYVRWAAWNDFWFGLLSLLKYFWFTLVSRFSRLPLKRAGASKGLSAMLDLARSPTLSEHVAKILKKTGCRIVVLGHTHIPIHKRFPDGEYLNPGTWNDITSLDLDNLGHHSRLLYVILEHKQDKWHARILEWRGFYRPYEEFSL